MFIETKEGYVCDCGTNIFTIVYNDWPITLRNRVIFSKTMYIDENGKTVYYFQLIFANDKPDGEWFSRSLRDLHYNCNHKQRAHFKKDFIKSCNKQIAATLEKLYSPGGEKYLEAEKKLVDLNKNN